MRQADYIIAGQGLAGSCVALHLLMRNRRIIVLDDDYPQAASRVAAGLFNPVTGKMPALTWMADDLFTYAHEFYAKAEQLTGLSFFYPMPVYRPFISDEEQRLWLDKSRGPRFARFIQKVYTHPVFNDEVTNPYGGIELRQSGYVNTSAFLQAVRNLIIREGLFILERFDEGALKISAEEVIYQGYVARGIIICTGINTTGLFNFLPVSKLKGEVLLLRSNCRPKCIYNRGVYVVPGVWKAGATYNKHDSESGITAAARAELEAGLQKLIRYPYEIIGQDFGFRPVTPDRRPLLGRHPEYRNVYIFNGLGTKGVTLAPFFSAQLVDFIENDKTINQEADIKRYIFR
ncbi:MAG: FAD-binding oxidoreductase [Cyclobacteriaceae bacterium]|nr:FAD-binding oxidoreductase [Cyclobacteriaceae bacterium]